MINDSLQSLLLQLCTQGFLERNKTGSSESKLFELLNTLGISHLKSNQLIKIESAFELINPESIKTYFIESASASSYHWQYRLITESTNADALQLFKVGQQPCIVLAEKQTGGRGRRGRTWVSPFGKNIYCTIGMHKSIKGCNPGLLSIVTGIALCKALESCGIQEVKVKWPNDLYYQNQKLGGILIESRMCGGDEYFFAIGFGINVSMGEQDFNNIPQPATSVNLISSSPVSRNVILGYAIQLVVKMVEDFDASQIPQIIEAFNSIDALHNAAVTVTTSEQSIEGVNAGINQAGQLLLDTANGQLEFSAADISVRGR